MAMTTLIVLAILSLPWLLLASLRALCEWADRGVDEMVSDALDGER